MPDTNANSKEAALATLMDRVFVPQFVKTCAERGLVLETPEQVREALVGAIKLSHLLAIGEAQRGEASEQLMKSANAALDNQLSEIGFALPSTDTDEPLKVDGEIKNAAAGLTAAE